MAERENAIRALYEREYDALCRAAYRTLGDWEAAQDLVQDTFLLALLRGDDLAAHPSPGGWLTLTLRNLIQNERRKLVTRASVPLDDAVQLGAEDAPPLSELLPASLSEQERQLLSLRFEWQQSYREMGERLGMTEGACRVKLFRVIEKCRKQGLPL